MHYFQALCSGRISCYLTCLLHLTTSPHLCPGNLTCLLSLNFASARSLSACSLPGLPLRRLLPHSQLRLCLPTRPPDGGLFGQLNIVNKVLKYAGLYLCCSSSRSHTRYNNTSKFKWFATERQINIDPHEQAVTPVSISSKSFTSEFLPKLHQNKLPSFSSLFTLI